MQQKPSSKKERVDWKARSISSSGSNKGPKCLDKVNKTWSLAWLSSQAASLYKDSPQIPRLTLPTYLATSMDKGAAASEKETVQQKPQDSVSCSNLSQSPSSNQSH